MVLRQAKSEHGNKFNGDGVKHCLAIGQSVQNFGRVQKQKNIQNRTDDIQRADLRVGKISGEKRRVDVDDEIVVERQQNVGQKNSVERFALTKRCQQVFHENIIAKKNKKIKKLAGERRVGCDFPFQFLSALFTG